MAIHTTYSKARAKLASLWDHVEKHGDIAVLHRRGHRSVALVDAEELESLQETAHLLRSPRNALRLLTALKRSLDGTVEPMTVRELREGLGLETAKGPESS